MRQGGASPQQQKGVTLRKCFREPIGSMPGDKKTIYLGTFEIPREIMI